MKTLYFIPDCGVAEAWSGKTPATPVSTAGVRQSRLSLKKNPLFSGSSSSGSALPPAEERHWSPVEITPLAQGDSPPADGAATSTPLPTADIAASGSALAVKRRLFVDMQEVPVSKTLRRNPCAKNSVPSAVNAKKGKHFV